MARSKFAAVVVLTFFARLRSVVPHPPEAEADRVSFLPGISNESIANKDMFAGFVSVKDPEAPKFKREDIFYWFVESESETRATDPLVLWTNGGPGCSGLLGMLTENGPFRTLPGGAGLRPFEYSWTKHASIVFVEQPVFTGFSISSDEKDARTDDALNARKLTLMIDRFLDKFPLYRDRDLYLAGESYGGHYLPFTTKAILAHNAALLETARPPGQPGAAQMGRPLGFIQLRGFLVGNPYTNVAEGNKGLMDAIWGHGLLPTPEYQEWEWLCEAGDKVDDDLCEWLPWGYWATMVPDDVDPYALSFPSCPDPEDEDEEEAQAEAAGLEEATKQGLLGAGAGADGRSLAAAHAKRRVLARGGGSLQPQRQRLLDIVTGHKPPSAKAQESAVKAAKAVIAGGGEREEAGAAQGPGRLPHRELDVPYEPCREGYLRAYLNRADVRQALHVNHARQWTECDDLIWEHYDDQSKDAPVEHMYLEFANATDYQALRLEPLKILVFSGDDDAVCGTHGTVSWLFKLGLNVTSYWKPWRYQDPRYGPRLGGLYTMLDGLHFATVHGAGHEVPTFKPAPAFQLFKNFLALESTGGSLLGGQAARGPDLMAVGVYEDDDDEEGWEAGGGEGQGEAADADAAAEEMKQKLGGDGCAVVCGASNSGGDYESCAVCAGKVPPSRAALALAAVAGAIGATCCLVVLGCCWAWRSGELVRKSAGGGGGGGGGRAGPGARPRPARRKTKSGFAKLDDSEPEGLAGLPGGLPDDLVFDMDAASDATEAGTRGEGFEMAERRPGSSSPGKGAPKAAKNGSARKGKAGVNKASALEGEEF